MNITEPKYPRILAIAHSTVGLGFAVFEGQETLVDWGVKWVKGDKNIECLSRVEKLIVQYKPNVIVLEDTSDKDSKRGSRTKTLTKKIIALATSNKVKVTLFSQKQIRKAFFTEGEETKQALAEIIAKRFPDELAHQLPPKRREWDAENPRMGIFDAVALALTLQVRLKLRKKAGK